MRKVLCASIPILILVMISGNNYLVLFKTEFVLESMSVSDLVNAAYCHDPSRTQHLLYCWRDHPAKGGSYHLQNQAG